MSVSLIPATEKDCETVIVLSLALAREEGTSFKGRQETAIELLLGTVEFGRIFLIDESGVKVGYAALSWGFSIEYGGRDGFLDEFYIVKERRGQGIGAAALHLLEKEAFAEGLVALHLEVLKDNKAAADFYHRNGYADQRSLFMSKRLLSN